MASKGDEIRDMRAESEESRGASRVPERGAHRYSPYKIPQDSTSSSRRGGGGGGGDGRVFVANLDYSVTWQALKSHMTLAGEVERSVVFKNPDGSSKGMGVVTYADPSCADLAVAELKDSLLGGRRIFVRKHMEDSERERIGMTSRPHDRPRPPSNPAATVFVGNLDFSVTWQKLKDCFKVAGNVVFTEIQTDKQGSSRGMGTVQYDKTSDAINAIALFHGQILHNRPMTVRMDNRSPVQVDPVKLKLACTGFGSVTGLGLQAGLIGGAGGIGMGPGHSMGISPELFQSSTRSLASTPDATVRGSQQLNTLSPPVPVKGRRLFVRNLNFKTPWQKLKDTFCKAGPIEYVDMMKNQDGRPNGRAYVLFETPQGAGKAVELFNNSELDGRKLEVAIDKNNH